jgi:hypothetical protein
MTLPRAAPPRRPGAGSRSFPARAAAGATTPRCPAMVTARCGACAWPRAWIEATARWPARRPDSWIHTFATTAAWPPTPPPMTSGATSACPPTSRWTAGCSRTCASAPPALICPITGRDSCPISSAGRSRRGTGGRTVVLGRVRDLRSGHRARRGHGVRPAARARRTRGRVGPGAGCSSLRLRGQETPGVPAGPGDARPSARAPELVLGPGRRARPAAPARVAGSHGSMAELRAAPGPPARRCRATRAACRRRTTRLATLARAAARSADPGNRPGVHVQQLFSRLHRGLHHRDRSPHPARRRPCQVTKVPSCRARHQSTVFIR